MHYLVDTDQMQAEGLMSATLVQTIKERSRAAMVALGVNTVLAGGIAAAAGGFVFWLADTLSVAITGGVFLLLGVLILLRAGPLYRMLGNAAGLIGGGMLCGGATLKLLQEAETQTSTIVLLVCGGAAAFATIALIRRNGTSARFLLGAIALMSVAMHLIGLYTGLTLVQSGGILPTMGHLYTTLVLLAVGYVLDLRFVSALAIAPFAQMLDTSTSYYHAAYVFYSPEATFSILQMALAMIAAPWLVQNRSERIGRHAGIFAIMAFIVGNLSFLVGSLWGDLPGESYFAMPLWEDHPEQSRYDAAWTAYNLAIESWRESAINISPDAFSIAWAIALLAMAAYAAFRGRRGLFNAALTFGAIHAYTQMFERFGDEPLAFVIGGLAAVPLAWGMWRINEHFAAKQPAA